MYLNILLFANSITFLIIYHMLSQLKYMIRLEIFMRQQITVAIYEEYASVTGRMDVSSAYQVSFLCSLYVATSMCWLCMQCSQYMCVACVCSIICSFLYYSLSFCVVTFVILCSMYVIRMQFKYKVLQLFVTYGNYISFPFLTSTT